MHRVIEKSAGSPAMAVGAMSSVTPSATTSAPALRPAARSRLRELWRVDFLDSRLQFLPGPCEILKKFNFTRELDDKRFVFVRPHDVIKERPAGVALLPEHTPLAHAGVDEQAQRERQIGFLCKVGNCLWLAVLVQRKIVFGQIGNDVSMLVSNRSQQVDRIYV